MNVIYVINICFQCSFPTPEPPDGCSAPPGRTSEGSWWRWRLLCKPQTHIDEARGWSIEHKTSKVAYNDVNMNSVDCQATLLPAILSSKHLRPLNKRFLTRERKGMQRLYKALLKEIHLETSVSSHSKIYRQRRCLRKAAEKCWHLHRKSTETWAFLR